MINTIKKLMDEMIKLETIANAADEAYENDPENEEIEKAFCEAYDAEWHKCEELINAICKFAPAIDKHTARKMIKGEHRNELLKALEGK